MREIKFRYIYQHQESKKILTKDFTLEEIRGGQALDHYTHLNDEHPWATWLVIDRLQYTGLKDKNGKDIFQKDLLGEEWSDGYIDYCDKCKSFEYFTIDGDCMSCEDDIFWRDIVEEGSKLEVIGNIFENPELLRL
jgi:uncharacterized phage protein (TIGR01671 family)